MCLLLLLLLSLLLSNLVDAGADDVEMVLNVLGTRFNGKSLDKTFLSSQQVPSLDVDDAQVVAGLHVVGLCLQDGQEVLQANTSLL